MTTIERKQTDLLRTAVSLVLLAATLSCHEPNRAAEIPACADAARTASDYRSSLRGAFTPSPIEWAGRAWRVNAGATWHRGMDHSVRISPGGGRIRFELRDSPRDRSPRDSGAVRRAELSGKLYGDPRVLPNGEPLWGALSFVHHRWSNAGGMRQLTGGVYGQIHIGSSYGGSPALAFRRTRDGSFRITTRGQYDPEGTVRYETALSFDEVHDLVYQVTLHPERGRLRVWIDGRQAVDARDISVGHENAESYWNMGAYFSRGISGPVIAEYANHVYPARAALAGRTTTRPCWPAH